MIDYNNKKMLGNWIEYASLINKVYNQNNFCLAIITLIYFTPIKNNATTCFFLCQDIKAPSNWKRQQDVDILVSRSPT
jgi:hypothetical protein